MSDQTWRQYIGPDNLFQLELPTDAVLDENIFPAGEHYFTYTPVAGLGGYSILWESAPGHSPKEMLDLEQRLGIKVIIEVDGYEIRDGKQVYHLRYQTDELRGVEITQDPVTKTVIDLPEERIEEIADFYFWQGEQESLSSGFRVRKTAPQELMSCFERILTSFRLMLPLP